MGCGRLSSATVEAGQSRYLTSKLANDGLTDRLGCARDDADEAV